MDLGDSRGAWASTVFYVPCSLDSEMLAAGWTSKIAGVRPARVPVGALTAFGFQVKTLAFR